MELNIDYAEIKELKDFEFSTRLNYFLEKRNLTRKEFFNKNEYKLGISERTFTSYFQKKKIRDILKKKQQKLWQRYWKLMHGY